MSDTIEMRYATSTKAAAREIFLANRLGRPDADIAAARSAVRAHVLTRATAQRWRTVAGYVPMRTEPGSIELLDGLVDRGLRVIVPVLCDDNDLDWTTWPAQRDRLGAVAIAEVDAVLVPALAVTPSGVRLGRGGGSYDRALARLTRPVARAALLYSGELVDELPSDPWDIPVTAVVSPGGWISLGGPGLDAE